MKKSDFISGKNFYKLPLVHVAGQNGDGTYRQAMLDTLKIGERLKIRYYVNSGVQTVGIYTMQGSMLGDLPEDYSQGIIQKIQRFGDPIVRAAMIEGSGEASNKGLVVTLTFGV